MLRHKHAAILFLGSDSLTNKAWVIEHENYLIPLQIKKLTKRPDLILQFSHYIANEIRKQGYGTNFLFSVNFIYSVIKKLQ